MKKLKSILKNIYNNSITTLLSEISFAQIKVYTADALHRISKTGNPVNNPGVILNAAKNE